MAETALGVLGLLGLFSAAVDCFEYVRIAKTFENDFATSQLKLDGARIRLSRWGAALGFQTNSRLTIARPDFEHAEMILKHLESLFVQAQSKSKIFARPGVDDFHVGGLSPSQSMVHAGLMTKIRERVKRERPVGGYDKGKWALYKKKELDDLVDNIVELVEQLEQILPMSIDPQQTLHTLVEDEYEEIQQLARRNTENGQVTPLQVAETMYGAAEGLDPYLEEFLRESISELRASGASSTTTYNVTQKMGDVKGNKGIVTAVK